MKTLNDSDAFQELPRLETEAAVDELLEERLAIIYKHSTMCSVSSVALEEMKAFAAAHPGHPVHRVDVIEDRSVSSYIESRTGVRHQSPQILVLESGEVVYSASHFGVTARALAEHVA